MDRTWRQVAAIGNWIIWLGFLVEVVFVVSVAPRKKAALRTHWLDVAIVFLSGPLLPALLSSCDSPGCCG